MEAPNGLTTWVVFNERNVPRDIDLAFFSSNFFLLWRNWLRTRTTAVINDVLDITEERRMSMEINLSITGFVPLRVEQKVLGI